MIAAALNRTGILSIVDVILIICGIYCMVTAGKMKKNHVLPQWLFTEQELHQIRHPESFVRKWDPNHHFRVCLYGIRHIRAGDRIALVSENCRGCRHRCASGWNCVVYVAA